MSKTSWVIVDGVVVAGHKVASGQAADSPYPAGTIALQRPHFLALGMDLRPYFAGTLNVSIAPYAAKLTQPEFTFPLVQWHPAAPPETFSFSKCKLGMGDRIYDGWIYYPHPETKPCHFQAPDILELLMPLISAVNYGSTVQVWTNPAEVALEALGMAEKRAGCAEHGTPLP